MASGRIKGITVEIDGSTTGLTKALKETESNLSSVQRSLKDVNKLLKVDPTNTELLTQKQKLLGQAVEDTKTKLEALKSASEQARAQMESGDLGKDKYDDLQREIIETEQKLKDLEKQAKKSSSVLGTQLQEAGKKISKVGDDISNAGEKMLPVTAAVAGVGVASVKTAANFESSMSQVQATMGITKDAMSDVNGESVNTMDALSALARQMGSKTAFSASECADAMNYLALAGYDTQEIYDTLPTVLNLAAAGSIDLADASDMVTDAMSALGMETSEADKMVDQMAKTSSSTNTSVAQLGEAILTIGATAKSVKGGTAELNTALGILANNGIKSAEGGTHLRNVIVSLQSPTDDAADALDTLGVSVYDSEGKMRSLNDILGDLNTSMEGMTDEEKTNIINKIFNKTDISSVNALLANTGDSWDSLQQSITDSGGAAQQMADTQLDNLNGQLTILKSTLDEAAIAIGETLMPIVEDIIEKIQEWTDKFNGLDEGTKTIIVTIGLVVAAIGPVLIILGTLISSIGTITGAIGSLITFLTPAAAETAAVGAAATGAAGGVGLLSSGLIPIIAIIAAVVAAGVLLYQNWDTIKEKASELKEKVVEKVGELKEEAVEKYESLKKEASEKFESMKKDISTKASNIKKEVTDKFKSMKSDAVGKIDELKNSVSEKFDAIKSKITEKIDGAKDKVKEAIDKIKGFFDFEWSLPSLKLPHPYISGSFSLNPPSVPSFGIDWYKKGYKEIMSLNSPTIFGYSGKTNELLGGGEGNGNELVGGEDRFVGLIGQVMDSKMGIVGDKLDTLISVTKSGMKEVADRSEKNVVLSDGALVGKLTPKINAKLGQAQRLEDRYAW